MAYVKEVVPSLVTENSQHGFTSGKSCLTNLIAFYDKMIGFVDEGRAVGILYSNWAFSTVSHNVLSQDLSHLTSLLMA